METSLLDFFSKLPPASSADAEALLRQITNPAAPPNEAPTMAPCSGSIYVDKNKCEQPALCNPELVCEFSILQKPAISIRFYTRESLADVTEELRKHVTLHSVYIHPPEPDEIPLRSIHEAIAEANSFQTMTVEHNIHTPSSFCNVEVPYFIGGEKSLDAIKGLSHIVSDAMGMAISNVPVELELSLGKIMQNNHFDSTISALMFDIARNFISSEASQAGYTILPSYTIIDRYCNRACMNCYQGDGLCQCQGIEKRTLRHRTTNKSGMFESSLIFKHSVSKIDILPALQSTLNDAILSADTLAFVNGCVVGTLNPYNSRDRRYIQNLLTRISGSTVYIDKMIARFVSLRSDHALSVLAQTLRTSRCDNTKCLCKGLNGCDCPSVIRANLKTETPVEVENESVLGFDPDRCTFAYALETRKDEWTIRLRSKVTKQGPDCVTLAERQFAECTKDSDREFDIEIEMEADALKNYRDR